MRLVRKAEGSAIRPTYGRTDSRTVRAVAGARVTESSQKAQITAIRTLFPICFAQAGLRPHHTIQVRLSLRPGSMVACQTVPGTLKIITQQSPGAVAAFGRGTVKGASDGPRARRQRVSFKFKFN